MRIQEPLAPHDIPERKHFSVNCVFDFPSNFELTFVCLTFRFSQEILDSS